MEWSKQNYVFDPFLAIDEYQLKINSENFYRWCVKDYYCFGNSLPWRFTKRFISYVFVVQCRVSHLFKPLGKTRLDHWAFILNIKSHKIFKYFGFLWRGLNFLPFLVRNPILHVTLHKRWGFLSCQPVWKENDCVIRIP